MDGSCSLIWGNASSHWITGYLPSVWYGIPSSLFRVMLETGSGPGWKGLPLYAYTLTASAPPVTEDAGLSIILSANLSPQCRT